jgi:putative nucleotidyltransferase with HDIG domain
VSTLAAGIAFSSVAGLPPLGGHVPHLSSYVLPALAMTVTYFLSNSVLQAAAVAIESGQSLLAVWGQHALYLGLNYYAAASLATLGVANASGLNLEIVGLVGPLLILSYGAYKSAASRMEDADAHIHEVEHLYQATVETLAIAVDAKDQVTHGHIRRVQRHTLSMAHAMGVSDPLELKALAAAALLHDVGKLAVPDYVLNKPGALSHAEFDRMKRHAAKGAEILTAVEFPYPVVPVVRHHHEQWNGQGYPDGLAGESIPIGARILSVVDCFDALTSDRPYRRRMTDEQATAILVARSGTMYDPRIVSTFVALIPTLRQEDAIAEGIHVDRRNAEGAAWQPALERTAVRLASGASLALGRTAGVMSQKLLNAMPEVEVCLFAPEPGSDLLFVSYATQAVGHVAGALKVRVGEGLAGWVAANRHTIVNSEAGLDLGDAADRLALQSCTATPVFALGTLVGVLSVYSPAARGFTADEVRVIAAVAQEIGSEIARQDQPTFAHQANVLRHPRAVAAH